MTQTQGTGSGFLSFEHRGRWKTAELPGDRVRVRAVRAGRDRLPSSELAPWRLEEALAVWEGNGMAK